MSAPFCPVGTGDVIECSGAAAVPPAAAYAARRRGGRLCPPDISGLHQSAVEYGYTATVAPRAHSFLSCQKRMGRKEAPGTRYIAR